MKMEHTQFEAYVLKIAIVLLILVNYVTSEDLCTDVTLQEANSRVWLETQRPVYTGQVTRIACVVCSLTPFVLQLWESSNDSGSYKLVWSITIQPPEIGKNIIPLSPKDYITTTSGHRIGLTSIDSVSNGPISVLKKFDSNYPQLVSSNDVGPFETNGIYQFSDIKYPGMFHVELCGSGSEACPKTVFTTPTPPSPTPEIKVPCSGIRSFEGKVKLERERPLPNGILKALKVSLCNMSPVRIQLWDSAEGALDNFTLVWEKVISSDNIAEGILSAEEVIVPLSESEYINITPTYRIGIQATNPEDIVPIPFRFSNSGGNVITSNTAWDQIRLCGTTTFDGVPFPNEHYIEFCFKKGCSKDQDDDSAIPHVPCKPQDTNKDTDVEANAGEQTSSGTCPRFGTLSVMVIMISCSYIVL